MKSFTKMRGYFQFYKITQNIPKNFNQVLNSSNHTNLSQYAKHENKHALNADTIFLRFSPPSLNQALTSMLQFSQERKNRRKISTHKITVKVEVMVERRQWREGMKTLQPAKPF